MQDGGTGEQVSVNLRRFINYADKAIWCSIRDFDEAQEWRMANEFLPGDGDLSCAPSMQGKLEARPETEACPFMRSDGKGEPMFVYRADLAEAMEELAPKELDFLIKIFQEELPIALYAAEEGISTRMAYRRKDAVLHRLWESLIMRRLKGNECKNKTEQGKDAPVSQDEFASAGRLYRARHHRRAKW